MLADRGAINNMAKSQSLGTIDRKKGKSATIFQASFAHSDLFFAPE